MPAAADHEPFDDHTRGILQPARMFRVVDFDRYPAPPELNGLVEWFWSVRWDLPAGERLRQPVLAFPAVNVSVGSAPPPGADPPPGPYPVGVKFNGVTTEVTVRTLSGSGWNVAARSTTGGFGAWIDDVHAFNNTHLDLADVLPTGDDQLRLRAADRPFGVERTEPIGEVLIGLLADRPRTRIDRAREVAAVSAAAEADRSIATVGGLARLGGITPRTLQRMFVSCAGVSPTWVLRRFRLIDAAEHVRDGHVPDWAQLAVDLGYSDQAHLTRDFTATIGMSPGAYAEANRQAE